MFFKYFYLDQNRGDAERPAKAILQIKENHR